MRLSKTKRTLGGDGASLSGPIRAVGYVRCSTEEQTAGDYNTLESQKDIIARFLAATRPEFEFLRFYEDGGYSGKDTNRPGLQELIADSTLGKFEVVVTYKLDRITRSVADFFELDRLFQERDVSFISVKEQFDTSTAMGRAMRNIALTFAELEREMTIERIKDKMRSIALKGRRPGGKAPFGYRMQDGRLVAHLVEAKIVGIIFQTYAETGCLAAVRDKLIALGLKPRPYRSTKMPGRPVICQWSNARIFDILENRAYLGELRFGEVVLPNAHEAIVDEETFAAARARRRHNFRQPRLNVPHDYFLVGKVLCGYCGHRLTPKSTNHPGRAKSFTPYYECGRVAKFRGVDCAVRRVNAQTLERLFLDTVSELSLDGDALTEAVEAANAEGEDAEVLDGNEITLRQQLKDVGAKIGKLVDALEAGVKSISVRARLAELEKRKELIQAELTVITAKRNALRPEPIRPEDAREMFREFVAVFPRATREEKRRLADAILAQATVLPGKQVDFEFYAPAEVGNVVQNRGFGGRERTRTSDFFLVREAL